MYHVSTQGVNERMINVHYYDYINTTRQLWGCTSSGVCVPWPDSHARWELSTATQVFVVFVWRLLSAITPLFIDSVKRKLGGLEKDFRDWLTVPAHTLHWTLHKQPGSVDRQISRVPAVLTRRTPTHNFWKKRPVVGKSRVTCTFTTLKLM